MALTISITPTGGKVGDLVEIKSTSGSFTFPEYNRNVVTFNGLEIDIIAKIVRSDNADSLLVIVPAEAITGDVIVETLEGDSDNAEFEVLYEDIEFEGDQKPFAKATINDKIKTVGTSDFNTPLYNKDISYSNFVEVFDENSLLQNVYTIILTQRGERMFSEFGTNIDQKLFQLINDEETFKTELMKEIVRGVRTYESRVTVLEDDSLIIINEQNVNLILALQMPRGNVRELGITLKSVNNVSP